MKVSSARVCSDVRLMLNRDERHQSLIDCADIDTLTLDRMIHEAMPRAVTDVEMAAPVHLLEGGYLFAEGADTFIEHTADKSLTVVTAMLPPDFLRLVSFRLSDWSRAVTSAIGADTQLAAMMQLPGASALADNNRPLAVTERRGEALTLVTYSSSDATTATVTEAVYRPRPEWDASDAIEVSRLLYDDAIAACASRCSSQLS